MILKYIFAITLITVTTACVIHHKKETLALTANEKQDLNIVLNMDQSVKACDDFYAYACGSYTEHNNDDNYREITSQMNYIYNQQLLNLMDSLYQQDYHVVDRCQTFIEKARIYLKSCRRQRERDINKYFEELKPGNNMEWPIWDDVQQWQRKEKNNSFDVWTLLGKMQAYGLNNVLVNQEILAHKNGTFSIMLQPVYLEDNTTLPDENLLKLFIMKLNATRPKQVLRNLKNVNENLLEVLLETVDDSEFSVELHYQDLDAEFPNLNLKQFLRELFSKKLPADTLISIRNKAYFQYLNDNIIRLFPEKDLCNYLMLKFLLYVALDSTNEFSSIACIKDLRNKMDVAVNYLYYKKVIGREIGNIESDISKIQQRIIKAFSDLFQENRLRLTSQQIKLLKEKLNKVTLNIGNLPLNPNNNILEKYYENLQPLDKNNYFKNHLILLKHRFQKSLLYEGNQTHYLVTDNKLGSSSGAFYTPKQNMIVLQFASLQMPFYDLNYNALKKYSLLAFILAHEYAHAFDTTGLYYDGYGNSDTKLPTITDEPTFNKSLECLQSQLSTDSIDERLADIVASRVVFDMFKANYGRGQYTWQKNFFLNMAQFFCGKTNIQFVGHDTDAERLNQIAMNSKIFAEAFQCRLGSKMNPNNKCHIY